MHTVSINSTALSISAYIMLEHSLASSELTRIVNPSDYPLPEDTSVDSWYFYSRLYVPPKYRRQGLATKLLTSLAQHSDFIGYGIFCAVNAYNDGGPDLAYLTEMYCRHGFSKIEEGLLIRLPRR